MKNVLIYGDSNTWGYDSARYPLLSRRNIIV